MQRVQVCVQVCVKLDPSEQVGGEQQVRLALCLLFPIFFLRRPDLQANRQGVVVRSVGSEGERGNQVRGCPIFGVGP